MNNLAEKFQQAFRAIKENRTRTIMSIVGIAVGIAAVMTIGVLSQSGKRFIYAELETYGLNSVWVYRKWEQDSPFAAQRQGSGITTDDYLALTDNCCSEVVSLSPVVYTTDWLKTIRVGSTFNKSSVEGVGVNLLKINNDSLSEGRNFRSSEIRKRKNVALIGQKVKEALFGENANVIGKTIKFDNVQLTIIGVLKEKNRDFLSAIGATQGYDENNRVLIPYTFYQQILGSKDIHTLRAEARSKKSVNKALDQITDILSRRHNNQYKYQTESMEGWIQTTDEILKTISILGTAGALVALIVGGIGVFNIMSSAVIERTREIGIRKAIGASPQDIMFQFLMESVYISVIGGVVGIILGIAILIVMILWSGFMLSPAWFVLFVGLLVSVLVGISAGYLPARHASKMTPAEALRFE
ncbi:MAG: ABC transporter permease [Gammaproteobacteria bacterium]|nr:ABC transporter permease [Gammaproteobacteria bacterium]